jgi:hypothetical protein
MADRLFLFDDDDTDTEVTPFRFTGQRGLSVEDYEGGRVNFGSQFLQLPDLEAQTGIDVDPDEDITELAEPAKPDRDDDPSDVLSGTLNVPLFGGAEGQVRGDTEVTFYDDFRINTTGFDSYSDYLKSESQLADRVNLVQNLIEPAFTDREMQFGEAVKKTGEQTGRQIGEEVAETPSRFERLIKGELTAEDSAKLAGGAMAFTGVAGAAGSTFIGGKTVKNAFGKNSFRPSGFFGLTADMVHAIQYDHLKQIRAVRAANFPVYDSALGRMVAPKGVDTGFAMTIGNYGITRAPGGGTYTGNTRGMNINQLVALEAISKGYDPGNSAGINAFNSAKFGTVEEQGGMFISDNKMAGFFRPNGSFYDPRFGRSGAYSTQKQAETAAKTAGVSYDQFQNALAQARSGKVTLQQALTSIKAAEAAAQRAAAQKLKDQQAAERARKLQEEREERLRKIRERDEKAQAEIRQRQQEAAAAADAAARDRDEEGGPSGNEYGFDSGQSFGVGSSGGFAGSLAEGGRVGLAMGGAPRVASGFVDRPPDQVPEDQTVADNRPTQLPEGAFVINAAAAEFMGTSDVRKMLIDAHEEALRRGIVVDKRGNGAKLIDVAISSGEVVVAPHLAKIIGYDRLNKINNRGMAETRERIRENGQDQAPATMQAATGMLISGQIVKPTLTQQDLREQGFLSREYPAMPDTPIPSRDEDTYFGYRFGSIKDAIKSVEIKGFEDNPFIFTGVRKKGGKSSSAFGPMQITSSTLRDFKERSPEYNFLDDSGKKYVDDLIQQGDDKVNIDLYQKIYRNKKAQPTSKETKQKFGRYGQGVIPREAHEKHYNVVADMVLRLKLSDHENIRDAIASYGEGSAYANKVLKSLE